MSGLVSGAPDGLAALDERFAEARAALRAVPALTASRLAREIVAEEARAAGMTVEALFAPSRRRGAVRTRWRAIWRVFMATDWSLPAIGRYFGGRDPTTILHALRAAAAGEGADYPALAAARAARRRARARNAAGSGKIS